MNKTQFRKHYRQLVRRTTRDLLHYGEEFLRSRCVDYRSEPVNFRLPKNVLSAACSEAAFQWSPPAHDAASKKQIRRVGAGVLANHFGA